MSRFFMPFFYSDDACKIGEGIQIPAPDAYFEACTAQIEPFAFMDRVVIDSTTHQYREIQNLARGPREEGLLLARKTDLLLKMPKRACLVQVRYHEEVNRRRLTESGDTFRISGGARWTLEAVVGWKHPMRLTSDGDSETLNLERDFFRTDTGDLLPYRHNDSDLTAGSPILDPVTKESIAFDAQYRMALGNTMYPGNEKEYVSPAVFGTAMRALGELILPYAREGKLGSEYEPSISVSSLPPWQDFFGAETDYWVPVYDKVAALFHVRPLRTSIYTHETIKRSNAF